jgi:molybdopterin/thiamine biosynthesis adenylyltransferase/rhodanese-related sulfurtransferase
MIPDFSQEEVTRYSRHLILSEVGFEGQKKLKAASVLIVGTGGLGSPAALYLAAAGVGRIGLVDYDLVDSSNLQRQIIHGEAQVGNLKVESAKARMLDINPYIQVETFNDIFTSENAREIAEGYDLIIDGTDNFPTRYLINDLCVMTGRPFVYGSIFRFEGQVSVFDARTGPCYRCLFPEPPPPGSVPSCSEAGVFGVLPGTIGTLQATEAIKLICGIGQGLSGRLLLYDALDLTFQNIKLRKNPECKVCSPSPEITELIDYEDFCGISVDGEEINAAPIKQLSATEVQERRSGGEKIVILDVRRDLEQRISIVPGAIPVNLDKLDDVLKQLEKTTPTVMVCRTGKRSARAVRRLEKAGFTNVYNLRGGINAWAREVDPEMYQY